jgi:methionyl-tRNA synthetase
VLNKIKEWFSVDEEGKGGLGDWDISRDAPYFGIEIPDAPGKYFYVWLDAPIGYLASLTAHFARQGRNVDEFLADPATEQVHFIGKDITYFHTLFWPATLHFSGRKTPDRVYVHGFLTVNAEKMSKSRGTGIDPLRYLELGLDAEWLRYYLAAKLNDRVEDLDFNPEDFIARVNSDLIGKYINIASRAAGFLAKRFAGRLSATLGADGEAVITQLQAAAPSWPRSTTAASSARRCARSWPWPTPSTSTSTHTSPGNWPRSPRPPPNCTKPAAPASKPSAC